jgi:hypothetical protein
MTGTIESIYLDGRYGILVTESGSRARFAASEVKTHDFDKLAPYEEIVGNQPVTIIPKIGKVAYQVHGGVATNLHILEYSTITT